MNLNFEGNTPSTDVLQATDVLQSDLVRKGKAQHAEIKVPIICHNLVMPAHLKGGSWR